MWSKRTVIPDDALSSCEYVAISFPAARGDVFVFDPTVQWRRTFITVDSARSILPQPRFVANSLGPTQTTRPLRQPTTKSPPRGRRRRRWKGDREGERDIPEFQKTRAQALRSLVA